MENTNEALQKLEFYFFADDIRACLGRHELNKDVFHFEYCNGLSRFFNGYDYQELFLSYEILEHIFDFLKLSYEERRSILIYTLEKNLKFLFKRSHDWENIKKIQAYYYSRYSVILSETQIVGLISQSITTLQKYMKADGTIKNVPEVMKDSALIYLKNTILPLDCAQIDNIVYTEEECSAKNKWTKSLNELLDEVLTEEAKWIYIDRLSALYDGSLNDPKILNVIRYIIDEINHLLLRYSLVRKELKIEYKKLICEYCEILKGINVNLKEIDIKLIRSGSN